MQYDNGKSFHELIGSLLVPGKVTILAITGQAGAGKSNHVAPLVLMEAQQQGYDAAHLGLDSFFKLSSRQRKAWLEKGERLGDEEAAFRKDQLNWWDFTAAEASLAQLMRGQPLHLDRVYNRADGGELTGEVHIDPSVAANGMLIVFDGVATAHLKFIDKVMFVYADPLVRLERLQQRDRHRQGQEVLQRFELTEAFELQYFSQYWDRIDLLVSNNVDNPRVLQMADLEIVLSPDHLLAPC